MAAGAGLAVKGQHGFFQSEPSCESTHVAVLFAQGANGEHRAAAEEAEVANFGSQLLSSHVRKEAIEEARRSIA